jgi:hypothetical protein
MKKKMERFNEMRWGAWIWWGKYLFVKPSWAVRLSYQVTCHLLFDVYFSSSLLHCFMATCIAYANYDILATVSERWDHP